MHQMNDPLAMTNNTVFISCGCGWWAESPWVPNNLLDGREDATNRAKGLWVKHIKDIKVRFDGRMA
jgi:hypothetical protein